MKRSGAASEGQLHTWQALDLLDERYRANLCALASRDAKLAARIDTAGSATRNWFIHADGHCVGLGRADANGAVIAEANPVTHAAAAQVAAKLCPKGRCSEAIVVAGVDQGWLWDRLYHMPVDAPGLAGHRPSLFFMTADVERLRAVLHLHDWQQLLADPRVRLITGANAAQQLADIVVTDVWVAPPRLSVTLEGAVWPADETFEKLMRQCGEKIDRRLRRALAAIERRESVLSAAAMADAMRGSRPLRVLGISSRFAASAHQSMRSWLSAWQTLGHSTRHVCERADHESIGALPLAEVVVEFEPDLILLVNHPRPVLGVLGSAVPCCTWVQRDWPAANQSVGAVVRASATRGRDYLLGKSRQFCNLRPDDAAGHFIPCGPAVDEKRFAPAPVSPQERVRFGCEVSFIGHNSAMPRQVMQAVLRFQQSPHARPLFESVFSKLEAVYASGRSISEPVPIQRMIEQTLGELGLAVEEADALLEIFVGRINRAFYRQQALQWLAEIGVDLRIYGHGWEGHPTLNRFARGPASPGDLPSIYRASVINLHVCPFSSATTNVFEGLCAGGFFLLRETTRDRIARVSAHLHARGAEIGATTGTEFFAKVTLTDRARLDEIALLSGQHPTSDMNAFWTGLCEAAESRWTGAAGTLFDQFDDVAFADKRELTAKVRRFLADPQTGVQIAQAMRQRVIETASYASICGRTLQTIAQDISRGDKDLSAVA
jgi:hypothetical protein